MADQALMLVQAVPSEEGRLPAVVSRVIYDGMVAEDGFVEFAWQSLDLEMLRAVGFVAETRLRLTLEYDGHWMPNERPRLAGDDKALAGMVVLLDGPKAGEKMVDFGGPQVSLPFAGTEARYRVHPLGQNVQVRVGVFDRLGWGF